ncbi:MAG: hypothetical protein WBL63_26160 [Candidatus Acidiferrum sp.]
MAVIKHIGLFSALKIGFLGYAALGLLAGMVCSAAAFAGIPFGLHARMHLTGAYNLLPLILAPLFYGTIGGIVTVLGATIYNLASQWVGGLEVDIQ